MAHKKNQNIEESDDNVSVCGSFSGEAFSSTRRRNRPIKGVTSSPIVDKLTKISNKHQHNDGIVLKIDNALEIKVTNGTTNTTPTTRWNESFHHFRFIVCIMAGFSFGAMIYLRYIICVAILKMVDQSALYLHENPDKTIDDFLSEGYSIGGEFIWDNEIQHTIMSWYMFAYTIPQVPCTKIGIKMGYRFSIPIFLSLCIISNVLTPTMAYWGWQWVVLLRLVNGLGASAILPLMLTLIENWMPGNEISLGLTMAQVIQTLLISLQPLMSGYFSHLHWSLAFYVPGLVVTVFIILWLTLISDRPEDNKFVSKKELDHICGFYETHSHKFQDDDGYGNSRSNNDINKLELAEQQQSSRQTEQTKANLMDILKVPTFYVYIIMWMVFCSTYSIFNFIMPTYLRQFLKIGISHNGFYCALIQTGTIISCLWPHPCLYILQRKFKLSLTASRRITHMFLCTIVAATMAYVALYHDNQLLMFFISRCFHGSNDIVATGTIMSNFSKAGATGLAFSMINTVGNLSVVFASGLTGYILDHTNQSVEGWTTIFLGGAILQILMMTLYSSTITSEPIEFPRLEEARRSKNSHLTNIETIHTSNDLQNKKTKQ